MKTVYAISGKRGSGKSMLARYLAELGGCEIRSLADTLKSRCMKDFGLTREQVYGKEKEVPTQFIRTDGNPLTSRDIMIRMGIFYRSIDKDFWLKECFHRPDNGQNVVIDDIRFLNEIEWLRRNFQTKFIRIERLPELNVFKAALDDLSETELDTYSAWDYHLLAPFNKVPSDLEKFSEHILGIH